MIFLKKRSIRVKPAKVTSEVSWSKCEESMNIDDIDLNKTCCFTGHRPGKLVADESEIRAWLRQEINRAVNSNFNTFICGMADGVDVWAALEVLALRKNNPEIRLVSAVPFRGMDKSSQCGDISLFNKIISESDYVHYICDYYTRWCFLARDRWMVDRSERVIAVFNGSKGGTAYTLEYARNKGREIVVVNDAGLGGRVAPNEHLG